MTPNLPISSKFQNKIDVVNSSSTKYLPIKKVKEIVDLCLRDNKIKMAMVNVVYFDDDKIQDLNRQFLQHDYPTDVLTFVLTPKKECEIYIGANVVIEQSKDYGVSTENEFLRVAVHGALHFVGHQDDTPEKKAEMHRLEDRYLQMLNYGK